MKDVKARAQGRTTDRRSYVGRSRASLLRVALATFFLNALAAQTFTAISVATPYIGAALGVSSQEELWLTDAFLIALICVTPLSGFLAAKVGPKRLLLGCAVGTMCFFTVGVLAPNVLVLTALCFMMGLCSGFIVPTTQAVILEQYPSERRNVAMAIWGAGTMTGILLGASLTGLAIQIASWHQVFLISLPLGLGALTLVWTMNPAFTGLGKSVVQVDALESALLLTSLLALSMFINLGDNFGWFQSWFITVAFTAFVGSVPLYLWRARRLSRGILNLSVLRDTSFTTAAFLTFGAAFFGTGQFQIDMLGGPLKMSPDVLSLRSSLGAATLLFGVVMGGLLLRNIKPARLVAYALIITLVGKYAFTRYGYGMSSDAAIWPQLITGFGLGLIVTPLAVDAYRTLPSGLQKDAASLFALATQLGSGLGIALLGIVLSFLQGQTGIVTGGAALAPLEPFIDVFWIELAGTALLLPAALLIHFATSTNPQT